MRIGPLDYGQAHTGEKALRSQSGKRDGRRGMKRGGVCTPKVVKSLMDGDAVQQGDSDLYFFDVRKFGKWESQKLGTFDTQTVTPPTFRGPIFSKVLGLEKMDLWDEVVIL